MVLPNSDFLHPELTHQIIGACLNQRVLEIELKDNLKLPFLKEKEIDLEYEGKRFGKYFVDFIVDGKVVVELKRINNLTKIDTIQLLRYLNSLQIRVGLLINFGRERLEVKRVILPEKYLLKSAFKSA